jgi:multidrug resistance efflux pump
MTSVATEVVQDRSQDSTTADQAVFERIAALPAECRTAPVAYRTALRAIASHFRSPYAAINLCNASDSLDEHVTPEEAPPKFWERVTQAAILDSEAGGNAVARLYEIDGTDRRIAVLSVPLRDTIGNVGALALIADCPDRATAEKSLTELRSLGAMVCSVAASVHQSPRPSRGKSEVVQSAVERASRFGSLTELAFAITNALKTKYQCDRVVLGQVVRQRVRLLSISGMDALYPRSPGTRLIRQAMEECLDHGQVICSRPGSQWSDDGRNADFRLHRQWRSAVGDAAVASIPLFSNDRCVAVLSVSRPGGVGFQREELAEINTAVSAYGPALELVARASRSWAAQTRDSLRESLAWLLVRNRWGRKLVAATAVCLAMWFCFGRVNYHLSVPCQIAPTQIRHFSAPLEGVIASSHVQPGDLVEAGQLLYTMDTRELELQRRELASEAAVLALEVNHAVSRHQLDEAAVARAKLQVVQARLAGVEQRLQMTQVRAPCAGTVMSGDLARRVGDVVTLGEPLIEFAPRGSWIIELQVDDRNAAEIQQGLHGKFVTVARPDMPIACEVERVEPAATVADGKNVFIARATVDRHPPWMLSGMDGVATLDIGKRPVWWVALHRVIRFARLRFWF